MSHPQLDNLVRIGQLHAEPAAAGELRGLLRSGIRRLDDAAHEALSLEGRFDLAYNGAHALALAVLRYRGCRSQSRYLVFQCLQHTINLPQAQWRVLDQTQPRRVRGRTGRGRATCYTEGLQTGRVLSSVEAEA